MTRRCVACQAHFITVSHCMHVVTLNCPNMDPRPSKKVRTCLVLCVRGGSVVHPLPLSPTPPIVPRSFAHKNKTVSISKSYGNNFVTMKGSEGYLYGSGSGSSAGYDYDSYDDFNLQTQCGRGCSAGAKRSGSGSKAGGSIQKGAAYSQKHIRLREARRGSVK